MEKKVSQVMSKRLVSLKMEDSVRTAYQIMKDRKIRHLPVTDDSGEIIGILSDRDLQRAMTPHPDRVQAGEEAAIEFNPRFKAKDFMSWPVQAVDNTLSLEKVADRMVRDKISALLVQETHVHGSRVVGIVTTDDLLRVLITMLKDDPERSRLPLQSVLDRLGDYWRYETYDQ